MRHELLSALLLKSNQRLWGWTHVRSTIIYIEVNIWNHVIHEEV
jgi:hypothetical protein